MSLFERLPPPQERFSKVLPAWAGHTVACIASGPSLAGVDLELLRAAQAGGRVKVIVCNDNYLRAPWADVLYFVDAKWLDWHQDKPEFEAFAGDKCSLAASTIDFSRWPALHVLQRSGVEGLSWAPQHLHTGNNTGHQILNIAALSGAKQIWLLGYDGKRGRDGKKHWFGEHPDQSEPPYAVQRAMLRTVDRDAKARGIRIINCSPDSALETFDKATLESVLPDPAAAALSE